MSLCRMYLCVGGRRCNSSLTPQCETRFGVVGSHVTLVVVSVKRCCVGWVNDMVSSQSHIIINA